MSKVAANRVGNNTLFQYIREILRDADIPVYMSDSDGEDEEEFSRWSVEKDVSIKPGEDGYGVEIASRFPY